MGTSKTSSSEIRQTSANHLAMSLKRSEMINSWFHIVSLTGKVEDFNGLSTDMDLLFLQTPLYSKRCICKVYTKQMCTMLWNWISVEGELFCALDRQKMTYWQLLNFETFSPLVPGYRLLLTHQSVFGVKAINGPYFSLPRQTKHRTLKKRQKRRWILRDQKLKKLALSDRIRPRLEKLSRLGFLKIWNTFTTTTITVITIITIIIALIIWNTLTTSVIIIMIKVWNMLRPTSFYVISLSCPSSPHWSKVTELRFTNIYKFCFSCCFYTTS